MAYEGFFRFGGNEIVNNERARGIASTADCPMTWLKGPRCTSLSDALGDPDYTAANLPSAPWFDSSLPDVSGRFYGVFALGVSGLNDSTRSASVVEGIDDGASIGRTRKGARSVRVRAMLLARGRDALDYGVSWLNAALDPDACGQHGTGCGTTDLEYLTDCPPARGEVPDFTPWAEARRNLVVTPIISASVAGWIFNAVTHSAVADGRELTTTNGIPANQYIIGAPTFAVAPGSTVTFAVEVENTSSQAITLAPTVATSTAPGGPSVTIPSGESRLIQHSRNVGAATAAAVRLIGGTGGVPAGVTFIVRDGWTAEIAESVGSTFTGDTAATELRRYSWAGAANASESIEEARSPIERPRTDEEYAELVDPYRRFLHNVSVTSGPLERELMNKGEFWGQIFEWTYTAGRPWVYSVTRAVELPITPTIVIQDTPYNLAPYPSAEVAGANVDAAINYSTNPSVETNATGWKTIGGGTTFTLTSGRVTGELSAVGSAAFRVVGTGVGAGGSAPGYFGAAQEVTLGAGSDPRYSVNIWAAQLLMSGTPSRGDMEVHAVWLSSSGGDTLRDDLLGTIPLNGGAISARSLQPPAGATHVEIQVKAWLTSWPAGTVVRLYADALAVTVP